MNAKYKVVVLSPEFENEGIEWVYQVEEQSSHFAEFRVMEEWVAGLLEVAEDEEQLAELTELKTSNPKSYEYLVRKHIKDAGYKVLAFRADLVQELE